MPLTLLGLLSPPGMPQARAAVEEVTAHPPMINFVGDYRGVFVQVLCLATASSERAAWTRIWCEVDGTHWWLQVPRESPVMPETRLWDMSETQVSGPAAAAQWIGGGRPPMMVCAYAEASFNQPNGQPPNVVTDGPVCTTVTA